MMNSGFIEKDIRWDHETARFAVLNFLIDCMKQTLVSMIQEAEDKNIRDRLKALLALLMAASKNT